MYRVGQQSLPTETVKPFEHMSQIINAWAHEEDLVIRNLHTNSLKFVRAKVAYPRYNGGFSKNALPICSFMRRLFSV